MSESTQPGQMQLTRIFGAYSMAAVLLMPTMGVFARSVARRRPETGEPRKRRRVDDRTGTLPEHLLNFGSHAQPRALQIDLNDPVEGFLRPFRREFPDSTGLGAVEAGIVERAIDASERFHGRGYHGGNI
jgi:hypothetical protein